MSKKKEPKTAKRPTIRQIAGELDMSIATVSRVINNKPDVNPQLRERVITYLRGIDYQPPVVSSDLGLIGLVDTFQRHHLNSYYISAILAGADEQLHRYKYNIVLIHFDQIESEMMSYGQVTILNRLKGLLWLEPMFGDQHLKIVRDHRLPCVVLNNSEEGIAVDLVKSDNYHASRRAVAFLVARGHRRIGFVGGWLHLTNHRDRLAGYIDGLSEASIEQDENIVVKDVVSWDEHGGYEGMNRAMSRRDRPTAVLVCSDFLAGGVYSAVADLGLRVPNDVSVVSFDDFPLAAHMNPPLTTFRQPLREMGAQAANLLAEYFRGNGSMPRSEQQIRQELVACPMISRESVGAGPELQGNTSAQ